MIVLKLFMVCVALMLLGGCGEDKEKAEADSNVQVQSDNIQTTQPANANIATATKSAGGVTVDILPENPVAGGCLRAVVSGTPGRSAIIWKVNGQVEKSGTDQQFCNGSFKRGDQVSVIVGTSNQGAEATVTIANAPPRVVGISSTPEEIYAGVDVSVIPVAEDPDDDDVDFYYQWLINGEAKPELTEATLPGGMFTKGDTIQVQIVPNDFYEDGPTYESYGMTVPNAAPRITSQPPQEITSLDYEYQVVVSDPDDDSFSFRLEESPAEMTIDESSGLIKWSLLEATPGEHRIAIIVADPEGAETAQEYTLALSPAQ